jgi:hypothetical protein
MKIGFAYSDRDAPLERRSPARRLRSSCPLRPTSWSYRWSRSFVRAKQVIRDTEEQIEGVIDASFADLDWDASVLEQMR